MSTCSQDRPSRVMTLFWLACDVANVSPICCAVTMEFAVLVESAFPFLREGVH